VMRYGATHGYGHYQVTLGITGSTTSVHFRSVQLVHCGRVLTTREDSVAVAAK